MRRSLFQGVGRRSVRRNTNTLGFFSASLRKTLCGRGRTLGAPFRIGRADATRGRPATLAAGTDAAASFLRGSIPYLEKKR